MLENISVLNHSCIRINKGLIIYIDPYKIDGNFNDADIIFITHEHYDHYSEEDIIKIKKDDTIIVAPIDLNSKLLILGFNKKNIISVIPNEKYNINKLNIWTLPAYNNNKNFHPKEKGWVGYIIEINNIKYYIAGDTDITDENKKIECDVAFVPVGGTYTMDYKEAAKLVNEIKPKVAVPIHYGSIVGTRQDALNFSKLLDDNIECKILMK